MTINPGDIVYCKVRGNTIVSLSNRWDGEIPFVVIGISPDNFLILHVPKYYNIHHSWKIEQNHINDYNVENIFKGQKAMAIPLNKIVKIIRNNPTKQDGIICYQCNKFISMAEPNQEDGSFICYGCRSNPMRKFNNINS